MRRVLANAGRSFIRAFIASLVTFLPGLLAAPDLSANPAIVTAALISSLTAGIRALQEFVPQLTSGSLIHNPFYAALVDSFTRAFLSTTLVLMLGYLAAPELTNVTSAFTALVVAAFAAGLRAVEAFLTSGKSPPNP